MAGSFPNLGWNAIGMEELRDLPAFGALPPVWEVPLVNPSSYRSDPPQAPFPGYFLHALQYCQMEGHELALGGKLCRSFTHVSSILKGLLL